MDKQADGNGSHPVQQASSYDTVGSTDTNVSDGFTMVAVGDLLTSRPLTNGRHPGFDDIVKILRDADVTFGNVETNIFDMRSFTGSPQASGDYVISVPEVGNDLKAMGFNFVSRANNHALDWGVEGMRETSRILDQNGIVHAGVGENLAQAGAARFLETKGGRVALLSFSSTFQPMSPACDPAGEAPGRPGLNPLRLTSSIVVPPAMMESLRGIRDALPGFHPGGEDPNRVVLGGVTFRSGEKATYSFEPDPGHVENILRNIRRGKLLSDFCMVAHHGHGAGNWCQEPPDYEREFAHKLIDAGADSYIGHGPHQLRGIEIYKGRPIFYSLGNFMFDNLQTPIGAEMFAAYGKDPRVNTDADLIVDVMVQGFETDGGFTNPVYYESLIAVSRFEQNRLSELRLYPVELGYSARFANRGVPRPAPAPQARAILERLQKLSESFGTEIAIQNEVGVIRLRGRDQS
ncbi:CapA family protein [Mesorhizobium sp. M0859]|uniref:CapA family protein n=1 Tax=Mesorhizobium sp. M0859 TaxID=2957014 RepID=UPI00333976C0